MSTATVIFGDDFLAPVGFGFPYVYARGDFWVGFGFPHVHHTRDDFLELVGFRFPYVHPIDVFGRQSDLDFPTSMPAVILAPVRFGFPHVHDDFSRVAEMPPLDLIHVETTS